MRIPSIKLNSGYSIPVIGLGTWNNTSPAETIYGAIEAGVRHIDTAYAYGNEKEVGIGVEKAIKSGLVKREDLFITTKLWNTFHRPDLVRKACLSQLESLRLKYVDLYLIHWPMAYIEEREAFPKDEDGNFIFSGVHYLDTWAEMEKLVNEGLARSIGVSNFNHKQLQEIIDKGTIKPAMWHVEINPYNTQEKLLQYAKERGVTVTGYSPFGSPERRWVTAEDKKPLEEPVVVEIAKKYGKSTAQVLVRFQVQRGIVVTPKSSKVDRIKQNMDVFDFELSQDDMKAILGLNRNFRAIFLEWVNTHPLYPFSEEF